MKTLQYPDGDIPKPYYYNSNDNSITLFLVFIILFLAIMCYIFYLYKKGNKDNNVITTCSLGYCATAVNGGGKRCPVQLDEQIYTNSGEVCNPPSLCTSLQTPYAVDPWGGTLIDGVCLNGEICGCTTVKTCPYYSMIIFTDNNDGGILSQEVGNNVSTGAPSIQLGNNQTCILDTTSLSRIGCNLYDGDIVACVQSNPCLSGVLSYIPPPGSDLSLFTQNPNNFIVSPLTCLPGQICKNDEISVFDSVTNVAICLPL